MNVMMMAAGEGTRLRPFTYTLPKPAMPFLNIPLASHSLAFLGDLQINKLVINTFHLPEKVHELFHSIPHHAKELHFSDEVGEILGNGGGLGKAKVFLQGDGDFIMMNSDEVILPKQKNIIQQAIATHKKSNCIATLLVIDHPEVGHQFGGVWVNSDNKVLGFGKDTVPGSHKGWHYIGVQILSEKIFQYIPPTGASNILHDVMKTAIAAGEQVQCFPFESTWFETGNINDFLAATKTCLDFLGTSKSSVEKESLQLAMKNFAADKMKIEHTNTATIFRAETSWVDPNAKLEGIIIVGKNAKIEKDSVLKNVILGEGVCAPPGVQKENTILL